MSRIWYTSDLHIGHNLVARTRGFDADLLGKEYFDHDATIEKNWRKVVKPNDTVWVLGDVTARADALDYALDLLNRLPGYKHLVTGNHDSCHPMHRNAHRHQREYLRAFESVQAFAVRKTNGLRLALSHFPYSGDHTESMRYPEWRLRDEGLILLHGHTHSKGNFSRSARHLTPQVHVGLDAWELTPVEEIEVVRLLNRELIRAAP